MIMENNKRLDLFDTRPHRNIYFISKHQILNQRPLLYRPIMAIYTAAVQLNVHFAIRTANSRRRFREQFFSKIPHTQDERVNPNESASVVMRFSANLKRKEERKIIRKKKYNTRTFDISMKDFCDKIPVGSLVTQNLKMALIPTISKQSRVQGRK